MASKQFVAAATPLAACWTATRRRATRATRASAPASHRLALTLAIAAACHSHHLSAAAGELVAAAEAATVSPPVATIAAATGSRIIGF